MEPFEDIDFPVARPLYTVGPSGVEVELRGTTASMVRNRGDLLKKPPGLSDLTIKIMDRDSAEGYRPDADKMSVAVSIYAPNNIKGPARLSGRFVEVLRLCFEDIDLKGRPQFQNWYSEEELFNKYHSEALLDFMTYWKDRVDEIIFHCWAGVSRSTGAALGLMDVLYGEPGEVLEEALWQHNAFVRETINEVAGQTNE